MKQIFDPDDLFSMIREEKENDGLEESANILFKQYSAFRNAGFNDDQSFSLTQIVFTALLRNVL